MYVNSTLFFLNLVGNLVLLYPGLAKCLHQSIPRVPSSLHHLILPLEPPRDHFIQEERGVPERGQRSAVQSKSLAECEYLWLCQGQKIVADVIGISIGWWWGWWEKENAWRTCTKQKVFYFIQVSITQLLPYTYRNSNIDTALTYTTRILSKS